MAASPPIVLFVARSSRAHAGSDAAQRKWLRQSLRYTLAQYEREYGKLADVDDDETEDSRFLVYVHDSIKELTQTREVFTRIQSTLEKGRREKRPVVFVINGWDGISANKHSLRSLFEDYGDVDAKLRFFVEDPRVSREVELKHVIDLITGRTSMELPEDSYHCHAKAFVDKVHAIYELRETLAKAPQRSDELLGGAWTL